MISYVYRPVRVACFDCIEIDAKPFFTMNCGPAVPACSIGRGFERDSKSSRKAALSVDEGGCQ